MTRKRKRTPRGPRTTVIRPEAEGANYTPKTDVHSPDSFIFNRVLLSIDWNTWVCLLKAAQSDKDDLTLAPLAYASEVYFEHVQTGMGVHTITQKKCSPVAMVARLDFLDFFRLNEYSHGADQYLTINDPEVRKIKQGLMTLPKQTSFSNVIDNKTPIHELGKQLLPREQIRAKDSITYLDEGNKAIKVRRPEAPENLSDKKLDSTENIKPTFSSSSDPEEIAEKITALRVNAGKSKVDLAKDLGKSEASVRQFERGDSSPTVGKIQEYAQALGYKVRIELVPENS